MVFSSSEFLFLFLPLCILLYFNPMIKSISYKNIILLIFSIIFYSFGSIKYLWVLLISIFFNYIMGLLIAKKKHKNILLIVDILANLLIFSYFKINVSIGSNYGSKLLPVVGPLGISFITFQEISYIIDLYRGIIPVQKNVIKYSLYISFFPQLIAGPIVRYNDIYSSLNNRKITKNDISIGIHDFVIGLFKKCVFADILCRPALNILDVAATSYFSAWLGAILLALQLYYDFSGYSNMAIGLGRIFGFKFKKNFDYPYSSCSVNEYWKRWNISLGNWFNDYLLYPIMNSKLYKKCIQILSKKINKKFAFKLCNSLALLICWIFVGLWHGIGLNFLFLGIYYFIFLFIEKEFKFPKKRNKFSNIYTLIIVCIGTVIFFSYNDTGFTFLKSMFINKKIIDGRFWLIIKNYYLYIILAMLFSFPIVNYIKKMLKKYNKMYNIISSTYILILFIVSIYFMIINGKTTFLYFNF